MPANTLSLTKSYGGAVEDARLSHDQKRDRDHRRKYNLGTIDTGVRTVPAAPEKQRATRNWEERFHRRAAARGKFFEPDSGDDSPVEASDVPEPDAGITYSYDAPRGPSHGSDILSMAINRAVERYETKATEKLVKDEYEVVHNESDADRAHGYLADEDDYELI